VKALFSEVRVKEGVEVSNLLVAVLRTVAEEDLEDMEVDK